MLNLQIVLTGTWLQKKEGSYEDRLWGLQVDLSGSGSSLVFVISDADTLGRRV